MRFRIEVAPPSAPSDVEAPLPRLWLEADRCGGNFSQLKLTPAEGEPRAFRLPDAEQAKLIEAAQAADPEIRPYFLQQAPDYAELKRLFLEHVLAAEPGVPRGVVGLDAAYETLRLADLLVPVLKSCAASGKPWLRAATL